MAANPDQVASQKPTLREKYDNYIGGEWVAPVDGGYFEDTTPIDGSVLAKISQSNEKDVDLAVKAAWKAAETWNKTSVTERSNILLKIADRIEENIDMLAKIETWGNGKPIRETSLVDLPLTVDHFRYFGGAIRSEAGESSDLDATRVSMEVHEPLGVVAQIIPWNFPILMAAWKLAPALAAGNCVVIKPAEQTPISIHTFIEVIADLLPPGTVNIVNGFGPEAGKPLATHPDI